MPRHIGRKLALIVALTMLGAGGADAHTRERPASFDRGIGHSRVGTVEEPAGLQRDERNRRVETNGPFAAPSASAVGNLIAVTAGNNATIVLNATQINTGGQQALNGRLQLD